MADIDEMVTFLECTAKVNRAITLPFLQRRTGLQVVDAGQDHGMVVTDADKKVSLYLLDGGLEGVPGVREKYPGSFSEEDDNPEARKKATIIIQIDPLDGTGDMVDTYATPHVVSPTTLVSKLTRTSKNEPFRPVAGFIFNVLDGFAIVSDGQNVVLYQVDETGRLQEVKYERTEPTIWTPGNGIPVSINRRLSYTQHAFDGPFMNYLEAHRINVQMVDVGGAGTQALNLFRNYFKPTDVKGRGARVFNNLPLLTILFNAQPDWKTWDTDATDVIARALGLENATSIWGEALTANAANPTLNEMHHTTGYVLSTSPQLRQAMTTAAVDFQRRNPDANLLAKDYGHARAMTARYVAK